MEMSALYRKRSLFAEHNLAHTFLLGVSSLSFNLQDLFEQEARSYALNPTASAADDEMENERCLHFMLGLLVVSHRFNQMMAAEKEKFEVTQTELGDTAVSENPVNHLRHLLR
jgi:hypothetical protein